MTKLAWSDLEKDVNECMPVLLEACGARVSRSRRESGGFQAGRDITIGLELARPVELYIECKDHGPNNKVAIGEVLPKIYYVGRNGPGALLLFMVPTSELTSQTEEAARELAKMYNLHLEIWDRNARPSGGQILSDAKALRASSAHQISAPTRDAVTRLLGVLNAPHAAASIRYLIGTGPLALRELVEDIDGYPRSKLNARVLETAPLKAAKAIHSAYGCSAALQLDAGELSRNGFSVELPKSRLQELLSTEYGLQEDQYMGPSQWNWHRTSEPEGCGYTLDSAVPPTILSTR